ncbi:MAG: bifunctional riboflavin kinase/FAD synthetase [Candidatus Dormibacteria bacterium]
MRAEFELPEQGRADAPPVSLAIGSFDGVHVGHKRVLAAAVEDARNRGGEAAVLTFEPHPRCVLDPDRCPLSLTTLDEKHDRLAAEGIDRLIVLAFTKGLSRLSAERFCERLCTALPLASLVVGPDFALGSERRGDVAYLRDYGAHHGFEVVSVDAARDGYQPISSSRVRVALLEGSSEEANRLLGHPYFVDAWVEHGDGIGARIGFPTANLAITPNKCLPARGVYATWTRVRGVWHVGATNVGYRPTFGGETLTMETHLLDFDEDIYRERVRSVFVARLRDERTYPDAQTLCAQIEKDVGKTRALLDGTPPPAGL